MDSDDACMYVLYVLCMLCVLGADVVDWWTSRPVNLWMGGFEWTSKFGWIGKGYG